LRGILRHCGVPVSTPHSSEFARLASGAFFFAIPISTFYDFIKIDTFQTGNESGALPARSLEEAVENLEREMIIDALKNTRGNSTRSAAKRQGDMD